MNSIVVVAVVVAFCAVVNAGTVSDLIACAEKVRTGSCAQGCLESVPEKWQSRLKCAKEVGDSAMPSVKSCIIERLGSEQCFDISKMRDEMHRRLNEQLPASASKTMEKLGSCMNGCFKDAGCDSTCSAEPDPFAMLPVADCVKSNFTPDVINSMKRCVSSRR